MCGGCVGGGKQRVYEGRVHLTHWGRREGGLAGEGMLTRHTGGGLVGGRRIGVVVHFSLQLLQPRHIIDHTAQHALRGEGPARPCCRPAAGGAAAATTTAAATWSGVCTGEPARHRRSQRSPAGGTAAATAAAASSSSLGPLPAPRGGVPRGSGGGGQLPLASAGTPRTVTAFIVAVAAAAAAIAATIRGDLPGLHRLLALGGATLLLLLLQALRLLLD